MTKNIIRTTRLTDRQVLTLIQALNNKLELRHAVILLDDRFQINILDEIKIGEASDESILKDLTSDRHAIHSATLVTSGSEITIQFNRGIEVADNLRQASAHFDEVTVKINQKTPPEPRDFLRCIDVIEHEIPEVFPLNGMDEGQDVISVLRTELAALNEAYRRMLRGLDDERIKAQRGFEEQNQRIESDRVKTEEKLKQEAQSRQKTFDEIRVAEEENLKKRTAELNAREQELDNRGHMHVRRDLREKQTINVKERLKEPIVSKPASAMRMTVFLVSIVAAVGLGVFALNSFGALTDSYKSVGVSGDPSGWPAWTLIIRGVLSSVLAGGLLVYAISWLRYIYLDDVRAKRELERYAYDIDRASWTIETVMEMGVDKGPRVPEAWIEGVCRNLFSSGESFGQKSASALALASLLNSSARVKIGPDGTEVEMKARGARKIANELTETD